jgi:hypothetical protein
MMIMIIFFHDTTTDSLLRAVVVARKAGLAMMEPARLSFHDTYIVHGADLFTYPAAVAFLSDGKRRIRTRNQFFECVPCIRGSPNKTAGGITEYDYKARRKQQCKISLIIP